MSDNHLQDEPPLASHFSGRKDSQIQMWVQEAIFGHRYVEEQLPYMLVLEVLAICRVLENDTSSSDYNGLFKHPLGQENRHEIIQIPIIKSEALRYILFKDRSLDTIAKDQNLSPEERFACWIERLNKGYTSEVKSGYINFSYLRKRFDDRFEDAHQAIRILQGLEIDIYNNRRYTSRFLVPRGSSLILNDVDEKFTADRRFFGRGGELVYLMLSRSQHNESLATAVRNTFLSNKDPVDRIAAKLIPDDPAGKITSATIGYLPMRHHPAYDRMAEDWLSILDLKKLPTPQKFEPLFRITALNMVRYFAERARTVAGNQNIEPIPLDMLGGRDADLRSVSKSCLQRHRRVIDDAVENYIRTRIEAQSGWQQAQSSWQQVSRATGSDNALELIEKTFDAGGWRKDQKDVREPERWLSDFINDAKNRSRNNITGVIKPLGTHAGFVVARGGAGTWFSSSDDFLEPLVLAIVKEKPITISDFLARLYERYGLVIGPVEANRAYSSPPCDISSFEDNVRAFERRLTGLGYVKRLSDDCAFVSNVYTGAE